MIEGYSFLLSCPGCGGQLEHVAGGSKRPWQQAAMTRCGKCRRDIIVNVEVSYADAGKLEDGQRNRRIRNAEHDAAIERSKRALAGIA